MMQQGKRILLCLITLVMVIGFVPFGAFANETVSNNVVEVTAQQLILGDDLTMRFYVTVYDSHKENSKMNITVEGETVTHPISEMEPNGAGQYVFSVDLAAAQMTSEIKLNFISDNESVFEKTYTIKEYAIVILEGNYPIETKQMVIEMLNYGTKAQRYFKHNLEKQANDGFEMEESVVIPSDISSVTVSGDLEGIKYYGATLVFDARLAVRYYFYAPNGVDGYTFTANNTTYTACARDGLFYIEIPEINPQDLDKNVEITVTAGNTDDQLTVNYSPMHYISRMYYKDSASAELKSLILALYSYHKMAVLFTNTGDILDLMPVLPGDYNLGTDIPQL